MVNMVASMVGDDDADYKNAWKDKVGWKIYPTPEAGECLVIRLGDYILCTKPSQSGIAYRKVEAVDIADDEPTGSQDAEHLPIGSRAITKKKLIMRTAAEAESAKVWDVPAGTAVIILESTQTRVKVAAGDAEAHRGWVTILGRDDGQPNLIPVPPSADEHAPSDEYFLAAFPAPPPPVAPAPEAAAETPKPKLDVKEVKPSPSKKTTPRKAGGGNKPGTPPKAGKAATGRKPIGKGGGKKADAGGAPAEGEPEAELEAAETEPEVVADTPEPVRVPGDGLPLTPASKLASMRAEKLAQAAEMLAHADMGASSSATLERTLGAALMARATAEGGKDSKMGEYVSSLMREWDKNKDGSVSKNEFKAAIRMSFKLKAEGSEIERLFDSLDVDGGGSLDLKEVKSALQNLLVHAESAAKEDETMRVDGEAAAKRATELLTAYHATVAVEREEKRLSEFKDSPSADALLGDALLQKINAGEKIEDILQKWETKDEGVRAAALRASDVPPLPLCMSQAFARAHALTPRGRMHKGVRPCCRCCHCHGHCRPLNCQRNLAVRCLACARLRLVRLTRAHSSSTAWRHSAACLEIARHT